MKKFWFRLALYLGGLVGIAWANYAVLLHFHPLEYYYTPAGMLLTAAVSVVECLIIWPASAKILEKFVLPALSEHQVEMTEKSVEAVLSNYRDYKERIITEFKDE